MKTLFKKSKVKSQTSEVNLLTYFIFFISFSTSYSQIFSEKDVEICNSKFELAVDRNLAEKTIGDVVVEIGKSFIGTDYLEHGLEKEGNEQLVINLTGLDCTTFLENSLVIARCIKKGKTSFKDYLKELQFIRYRNGIIDQYPSRLHYFSDWIYNNVKKGIIKDITEGIGGEPIKFKVDFMSTHTESYKQLNENPGFIPIIEKQEKEINCRKYYFIPKSEVSVIEDSIQNGDLIAITTTVKGLDIGHTGIAVKMDDGKTHLLHAPLLNTKVQISEKPLSEYLMALKKDSGIIVLRPLAP